MEVKDAMMARRSYRSYLPRAIPKEKIERALAAAQRSPSWANSQPWEVYVVTGEAFERIKSGYMRNHADGAGQDPDIPFPTEWTEDAKRRLGGLISGMKRDCGEAFLRFDDMCKSFFGAPAAVFLCVDRKLSQWSMYDLGAYSQSLLLALADEGIGGIQAAMAAVYPDIVRAETGIPDNLAIVIGIPIGFVDEGDALNSFVSERDPLEKSVSWVGWAG